MNVVEQALSNWKNSLPQEVPLAGLISISPIAYKWKALYRARILREVVFWRLHDLLEQSFCFTSRGTHWALASYCAAGLRPWPR